ncbi:MAG: type I glyceraldehyde-3-phosphate dehydrogenase [Firmicutes bacterium]|nr:type I glyceraldehyde-3-phosphate dehydrogenase [Bacillota bacterium]
MPYPLEYDASIQQSCYTFLRHTVERAGGDPVGRVRVAINGFGRIGRVFFRQALEDPRLQIVAINATAPAEQVPHLIRYDTVYGRWDGEVSVEKDGLRVRKGTHSEWIRLFSDRNPAHLPWESLGIDVVVEATGAFRKAEQAAIHLQQGAQRVVITAPASGEDLTIVMGVNEEAFNPETDRILSAASCTTNCLAPIIKVLHERFGVTWGFLSTVHALTNDQRLVDSHHKDLRRARAAMQSIIPTTTGAARAVAKVIPDLAGRLDGQALRVPVQDVSVAEVVCQLQQSVSVDAINQAMREASEKRLRGILDYCDEPLVSADFVGCPASATVDALSTMVLPSGAVRLLAWYDNEWGYCRQVRDVTAYVGDANRALQQNTISRFVFTSEP